MSNQILGWLPYGAADDSVVFRHALTTPIVEADISGKWTTLTKVGSGNTPTHDAVLGMKSVDSSGAAAGYRLQTIAAAYATALTDGGQITIECERDVVCFTDATNESSGWNPATANSSVLSLVPSTGATCILAQKNTDGTLKFKLSGAFASNDFTCGYRSGEGITAPKIHSFGKPDYVTVNIGWTPGVAGGLIFCAIDGLLISYGIRAEATTVKLFENLYIGSGAGAANTFITNNYIRNLQISSKPPKFAVHPSIRSIAFVADSTGDDPINQHIAAPPAYDNVAWAQMCREFHKRGYVLANRNVTQNPGYTIAGLGGTTQLEDTLDAFTIGTAGSLLATVGATQPWGSDNVVVLGGTNDFASAYAAYDGATFTAEYQDLIEQIMFGTAKTSRTRTRHMWLCTPPPNPVYSTISAASAALADGLARIAALPAWWDTTYGASYGSGRLHVIDINGELQRNNSWGALNGLTSDLTHYWYGSNMRVGRLIGRTILNYFS